MHEPRHRGDTSSWWIRPRALAALVTAAAGLATAIWLPGRNDVASATDDGIVLSDEFDGARGADVDRTKWRVDGDAELDGDGHLVLSRRMIAQNGFDQPFGHAEARIKVRRPSGAWRAFAAVDPRWQVLRGGIEVLDRSDATTEDDFHTYTVDWSPESILLSVDGRPNLRLTPREPVLPLALVVNFATDGRRPGRMVIDYVRVSAGREAPAPVESATPPPSDPATIPPAETPPPATTPPATTPPATTPPATKPPATKPPATKPPATKPPATKPPATKPPATKPPATKPPATKPAVPAWMAFTAYAVGDLVKFGGATYRVKADHTSLPDWQPTAVPNLFEKV